MVPAQGPIDLAPTELLKGPDRLGSLVGQRDSPFGIVLAGRHPKSGCAIGIGIQAVQVQHPNLTAPGTAPPGDQQCGTLEGTLHDPDGVHQDRELIIGDEPGNRIGDLGQITVHQQRTARHVRPLPGVAVTEESQHHLNIHPPRRRGQRGAGAVMRQCRSHVQNSRQSARVTSAKEDTSGRLAVSQVEKRRKAAEMFWIDAGRSSWLRAWR